MASRRFVDRGFWKCRELNGCSVHARLLAIYLFSDEADDFGRIKDDVYRLRNGCFPDDDLKDGHIVTMVDELVDAGFVKRYFARDDRPLLWLPTFQQYQPRKYWATSYLDRHPDDDFVVVDSKMVKGKKIKQDRPLSPLGHVNVSCAVSPQSATTCDNSPQVASPTPIPTPIPMSARDGAPVGQRAAPVAATSLSASAAESPAVDAEAALPFGGGTDAPTTNSDNTGNGNESFDQADDPAEASRVWGIVENTLQQWNGHDPGEQLSARAKARGMMRSHEGQVDVLAAIFDTIYATKQKVDQRWYTFGQLLKNRRSGSPEARKWAKGITG